MDAVELVVYIDKDSYADVNVKWVMIVLKDSQKVMVFCDGELRYYDIDRPFVKMVHEDQYVYIYTDVNIYQFKFEDSRFLVGDVLDFDFEHLEEYAMHVFHEDV